MNLRSNPAAFRWSAIAAVCVGLWSFGASPSAIAQPASSAAQDSGDVILNDGIPRELRDVTVDQNLGGTIPGDLPLVDSLGRKRRMSDFLDGRRPLVLTLNYSNCPMLCNIQLNQLAQSLDKMDLKIGDDFQLISVSIDPKETDQRLRDTKRQYIEQVPSQSSAEAAWTFCRTTKPVIDRLAEAVGFSYQYNPATKQYSHPAMLVFVSPDGLITRYSLGVQFPPDQMRLALVDAGKGNVGGVIDQFVLWCSVYDPAANSYVPQAWKIMRVGGAGTILLMTLLLVPYWRGRKGTVKRTTHQPTSTEPLSPLRSKPTQLFS